MKQKAAISALALLIAVPAWAQRGGGHGGFSSGARGGGSGGKHSGGSASGSGGHAAAAPRGGAPGHVAAPRMVAAPPASSAPRASNSGFTASRFVPPPDTAPRGTMQHMPMGTVATRRAPAATPPHVKVAWTTTTARMMTAASPTRLAVATAPAQPARPSVAPATAFQLRHRAFFASNILLSRRSAVFIFIGNGFPFFFDPLACDPFLVNPFCPFCATGRILKLNRPFARRAFFFDEFFPRRFFPAFGTGVFLAGAPMAPAAPEEAAEEERPAEAGMFVEGEPVPGAEPAPARPITLLQLKNGWMYGLTDYWIEGGRLHYLTTYGGENLVPLEQIDFDKTVQLNAERGVEFVLRPKPQSR